MLPGRIRVTAFTAFDRFAINPSALIAERIDLPFTLLEVAYAAVEAFVSSLDSSSFDRIVLMGVAGTSSHFRLETVARNHVDRVPDVRGLIPESPLIDPAAPAVLIGTLWSPDLLNHPPENVRPSDDAGGYLCNYLYFRMLQRFPQKQIGFLHVPPLEKVGIEDQLGVVRAIIKRTEPENHGRSF